MTKEATDTEDGEIVYTCKVCQMKDAKKIKAKPSATNGETPVEKPTSIGLIIGLTAAGLVAVAIVAVRLVVKKKGKKE